MELAERALLLLEHDDSTVVTQGLVLVRTLDADLLPVILRRLLKQGYRRAPHAFAMCTDHLPEAHRAGTSLLLWLLGREGVLFDDPTPEAAREEAARALKRKASALGTSLRQLARVLDADSDDFHRWARPLVRALDVLLFERDDPAVQREIEARCIDLLDGR
ncbi:MAG: hypothetical protein AAGE52_29150 [Myxococcota bacterium]